MFTNKTIFMVNLPSAEPTHPETGRYNFRAFSAIAGSSESRQARISFSVGLFFFNRVPIGF